MRLSSSQTEKGTHSRLAMRMPMFPSPQRFSPRAFYCIGVRAVKQLKIGLACELVALMADAKACSRQKQ